MRFYDVPERGWFTTEESIFIKINANFAYDINDEVEPDHGQLILFEGDEEVECIRVVDINYPDVPNELVTEEDDEDLEPWQVVCEDDTDSAKVVVNNFLDSLGME